MHNKIYITESEFINWLKGYLDAADGSKLTEWFEGLLERKLSHMA